ncbi:MAG TPA: hypothetical protein EYP56_09380 [Planctomycetaceae bacterium]|nr:hypothetical protein [Planctomycetaceae bacterium]
MSAQNVTRLAYKPSAEQVVKRLRSLYERRAEDRIFATMRVPSRAIADFASRHPAEECGYPDPHERAMFWDQLLGERAAVEDDSMPAAYLSEMDQGLYGGLMGGQVRFLSHPETGWISSMVPPLLDDWSQLDELRLDTAHPWWRRYLGQLDIFLRHACGRWGISHFILIDGLNFVFELVGATEAYLSVEYSPERVCQAMDLAFEMNLDVQRAFFERVPGYFGGTLSNFAQWLPGRVVSESLDPYHMTSVDYFERWGRQPAERIMEQFDGGVIHIHGNGRHLLEAAATLRGLKAMLLLDDVGFPAAFDVLEELKARVGDVPVSVFAPFESFAERLKRHQLPGGVLYQVTDVPDVDTANRLMDQVRSYRL